MVGRTLRFAIAAGALIASLAGATAAPHLTRVPAWFEGNDIFLQVSLDGGRPVWMQFDAAATGSALSAPCAAGPSAPAAGYKTVRLGGVTLAPVAFDPSSAAPPPVADIAVAGRLGRDGFGSRMLIVRYREREVWLSAPIDTGADPAPLRTAAIAAR